MDSVFPQKLNSPAVSVTNESFVPMLARLDECISFISSNVSSGNTSIINGTSLHHALRTESISC